MCYVANIAEMRTLTQTVWTNIASFMLVNQSHFRVNFVTRNLMRTVNWLRMPWSTMTSKPIILLIGTGCVISKVAPSRWKTSHRWTITRKMCTRRSTCRRWVNDELPPERNSQNFHFVLQCKECSLVFENSWSLHNHMQVKHLGPFPCIVCDRSCPTTKLLKRHMLTHTKIESDQPNQSRRFVNYCKYLQVDPNGTFTCKECGQTFETRKRFRTHVVESHDKSKNFFCSQCEKGFTLAWQLNSHVENTVSIRLCTKKQEEWRTNKIFHPVTQHIKKFQCTICGVFKNKQSKLQQHMKWVPTVKSQWIKFWWTPTISEFINFRVTAVINRFRGKFTWKVTSRNVTSVNWYAEISSKKYWTNVNTSTVTVYDDLNQLRFM